MSSNRLPNAILVMSGNGGVGKTWFSVNLAHALGNQRKRVLLFDGDLGLSNVDIQLGLETKWDIGSVLKNKCTFEDAILDYRSSRATQSNVDILAGRTIDGSFTTVSKSGVITLKDSLHLVSPKYDHMIMDLSAGLDHIIVEFSTFAQQGLVIVTNEPAAFSDAFDFIKVSSQRNPDLPLNIVINKVESHEEGMEIYSKLVQACRHFLKTIPPLVGIIHDDSSVPDSILRKAPTIETHPGSQVAKDIDNIAREIILRERIGLKKSPRVSPEATS